VRSIVVSALAALLVFAVAAAEEGTEAGERGEAGAHELGEMVVTATRQAKVLNTPASISVITSQELEEMGATNLIEALRRIPGVDDASSQDSAIAIRGALSAMTGGPVILIDGVPQKIGDYRYDQFSFIPVSQIDRVEVLRSAGIAHGPGAARGVINVITKRAGKDKALSLGGGASYGSWDTHQEYAGASGRVEQWDYVVNCANYSTHGYEDEKDDRVSGMWKLGLNFSEDTRIGMSASVIDRDYESAYGFAKEEWQLKHYRRDIHFPVSDTDPTLWWHTEKEQQVITLALDLSHRAGGFFLDSMFAWSGYDEEYRDLHNLFKSPTSIFREDKGQDTYTFTLSGGYELSFGEADYTPSVGLRFEGIGFEQTRTYPNNPAKNTDAYDYTADETQYGLYWDNDLLWGEHWGLRVGGRVDRTEVEFRDQVPNEVDEGRTLFSWSVAPSYRINSKGMIYASAGRNYWSPPPRYYEWAAERGGTEVRPGDLRPERSVTYEIGYKHLLHAGANIALSAYFTDYKDKFGHVYDQNTGTFLGLKNLGDAEAKGIEMELDGRPWPFLGYRLSWAYQDIEWTSGQMRVYDHPTNNLTLANLKGNNIHSVPKFSGTLGLDAYPLDGLKCSVDINHTGRKPVDYLNRIEYGSKTTVDVHLAYGRGRWKIWFQGKNIFNTKAEYVVNSTGKLTGANGTPDNAYYVQDGAFFAGGVSASF